MSNPAVIETEAPKTLRLVRRPKEEVDAISAETSWTRLGVAPALTEQECDAIGRGAMKCPHCDGSRRVRVTAQGKTTGVIVENYLSVHCVCAASVWFWSVLGWRSVPERFQDARLDTLVPRGKRQAEILAKMRERPADSYLLVGPPGTGKTHFSCALYRQALLDAVDRDMRSPDYVPHIWRVTASVLLNEHVAAETDKEAPYPTVTERRVINAAAKGFRPILFLDEIDKFPFSEFKIDRLGEIVDAVYAAKGQIVATANKDYAALSKRWDADNAGTILRRIGSDGGHTLTF